MGKIAYKPGDKVFAKVKGYPPWPAKIVSDIGKNRFSVLFYGTQETGKVKQENLTLYIKYRNDYVHKYTKRAGYLDAVKQIEKDLTEDGVDINQTDLEVSDRDIDITLEDASLISEKNTPKRKFHKTADNDVPAVRKAGRRKRSNASETNSDGAGPKKLRRDSTSSVASKSSKIEEEIVAPKGIDNSDKNNASETEEDIPKYDKAEPTLGNNKGEPAATDISELEEDVDKEDTIPNKKPKDDLEIVTKRMLNNFILYAEHVKKNPEPYKEKPVETTRDATKQDIYAFKLPSGKVGGVKLYKNWPPKHPNEYERALYDQEIAKAALEAESLLNTGEKTFDEIEMEVVPDIEITEKDLNSISSLKDSDFDGRKRKIFRKEIESRLSKWDYKIKSSLGLDNAIPDIAIEALEEFKEIEKDLDVLMFKKNPHVVDTLRRLRKYVGNAREWTISNSDLENFMNKATDIRSTSETIYSNIQSLFAFDVKDDKGLFWDTFMQAVSDFRSKCKELTETQVLDLCAEPDSRQAFFDMLLDNDPTSKSEEKI